MPRSEDVDYETRRRLAGWVRHYRALYAHEYERQADFARFLGISQGTLSSAMSGERTMGLDVLIKLHRKLHVSVDQMLNSDAPGAGPRSLPPEPEPPPSPIQALRRAPRPRGRSDTKGAAD